MIEKEKDREYANKLLEDQIKIAEIQDKKRADEWAARENKIKQAMNKMADTVVKKSNEAELKLEKKLVQQAIERDNQATMEEKQKKEKQR